MTGCVLMRQAKEGMRHGSPSDRLIGEIQHVGAGQPAIGIVVRLTISALG